MINIYDVILGIESEVRKYMPTTKFYIGSMPENPIRPSFLCSIAYAKDTRSNFSSQTRVLSIQLIYFGEQDEKGEENFLGQLQALENLSPFLNAFVLKVGKRTLTFTSSTGSVDEQLSIILDFKFKESLVSIEEPFEEIREIIMNEEEIR